MTYQTIRFEKIDAFARLTLHRPDRLNAFTKEMHGELRHALDRVDADSGIRALLITGSGRGFCAGQDLTERGRVDPANPPDFGSGLEANYNPLILRLRALPIPVVCAVNGVAAGAGANFALAGDIVVAARSASFLQAFIRIGLVPDCGGTWFLPRLAGNARAMAMALLGEPIPAATAAEWGLIWRCVDDDVLVRESEALAADLAARPTRTIALLKQAFAASAGNTLAAQLDLERDLQRIAGRTEDVREGIDAFLSKRPANFTGR